MPGALRRDILQLCSPGENEIDQMGLLDNKLGKLFAKAVLQLLSESQTSAQDVLAIGSHGQTIRHRPYATEPFTLQVGNAALIAELTGITTIADFRSRDMAAGGQGAPLVPAFHAQQFDSKEQQRCILNIGGISNITRLPGISGTATTGFDCGPGNLLMDGWCQRHLGKPYDNAGHWAGTGKINPQLLETLLSEPYFSLPPPKSTGRELFNLSWLDQQLVVFPNLAAEDVQATLVELTAQSIGVALSHYATDCDALYICGGGANNDLLIARITELVAPVTVSSSKKIGLDPDWVEACAFAWLAKQAMHGLPGNLPEVTGANAPVILGAIYPT